MPGKVASGDCSSEMTLVWLFPPWTSYQRDSNARGRRLKGDVLTEAAVENLHHARQRRIEGPHNCEEDRQRDRAPRVLVTFSSGSAMFRVFVRSRTPSCPQRQAESVHRRLKSRPKQPIFL